jgi:hypothetical protein
MSTYCLTFRISEKTVSNKTYAERRDALYENVRIKGRGFWEETTSFMLVESDLDTESFAKKACTGLSAKDDMLFIFDPDDKSAAYFGAVEYPDILKSFFPLLKNVPWDR